MADPINPTIPAIYKALRALEAEAQKSAADIEVIRDALNQLPGHLEEIVTRATQPLTTSVGSVKRDLAKVQTTVKKWKVIRGVVMATSAVIGRLVVEYIALRSARKSGAEPMPAARMTDIAVGSAGSLTANTASPTVGPALAMPTARRRALLVDDSQDILIIAAAFLSALEFDVVRAASAEEALFVLSNSAPVDLLVTDYAMPGMTGDDLVAQARERNPELRALIISGYADKLDSRNLPDDVPLLAKPFRRAELYRCILSVIGPSGHVGDATPVGPELVFASSSTPTEES
jgi:CheY-like chemotaxis protein